MKIQVYILFAIIIFFIGCGNDDSNSQEIKETKNIDMTVDNLEQIMDILDKR